MSDASQENTKETVRPYRRTVFFISGFHDFGFRFFWPILKRNAKKHERLYGRNIHVEECEGGARLKADDFDRDVEVDYRYLPWNDIAAERIKAPLWTLYWHMVARILFYHINGDYFKLMRAYWGFTNGVYYMLFTLLFSSSLVWFMASWGLSGLVPPDLLGLACLLLAYFIPCFFFEAFESYFRLKLMWQIFRMALHQSQDKAPDLEARIIEFSEIIEAEIRKGDVHEVLVIGHSYGSIIAVQALGTAMLRTRTAQNTSPVSLLTIGDINALYALAGPTQSYTEGHLEAATAEEDRLHWLCAFLPQDGLNFPKHNVAKEIFDCPTARYPVFKSLRMRELLTPKNYKHLKKSFWNMHFQYLKEGDVQGAYSYFRTIASSKRLLETYGITPNEKAFKEAQD